MEKVGGFFSILSKLRYYIAFSSIFLLIGILLLFNGDLGTGIFILLVPLTLVSLLIKDFISYFSRKKLKKKFLTSNLEQEKPINFFSAVHPTGITLEDPLFEKENSLILTDKELIFICISELNTKGTIRNLKDNFKFIKSTFKGKHPYEDINKKWLEIIKNEGLKKFVLDSQVAVGIKYADLISIKIRKNLSKIIFFTKNGKKKYYFFRKDLTKIENIFREYISS
jgi:hypothetical protein